MVYYPKRGDLVKACNRDNEIGVILCVFDPVVYQRGTAEVLFDNKVILVEHSYLIHVEGLPTRRPRLDTTPGRYTRLLRNCY
jgi:hypothetical protein